MHLGQAITRSILPALAVGPALGAIGEIGLIGYALLAGDVEAVGGIFVLSFPIALGLGLIIASPLALIFGTALLLVSARDQRWFHPFVCSLVGLAVGAVVGAVIASGSGDEMVSLAGIVGVLGGMGALIFRRMVRSALGLTESLVTPGMSA